MDNKRLGNAGEYLAAEYLEAKGHTILERGFRCKTGEIDLISKKENSIHFIEVKTRSSLGFGLPKEAVSKDKLRHINNTALVYIKYLESKLESELEAKIQSKIESKFDSKYEERETLRYKYSIDIIEVLVNHIEGVD